MSSDTERFRQWRVEQLARAQAETRQARQGLQKCQQGPQCCAGWKQRVTQAQNRAAALQDPEMSQNLYSMDSSGIGERKTIGLGRNVSRAGGRAGLERAEGDERVAMERGWGGGDDDDRR